MGIFIRDIKDLTPRNKTISLGIRFITIREPTVKDWLYLNSIDFEKMEIREICNVYIKTLSDDIVEVEKLTTIELVTVLQECFKMMSRNENTGEKESKESSDDIYINMSYRIAKFCKNTSTSLNEAMNTNFFIFNSILEGIKALEAEESLNLSADEYIIAGVNKLSATDKATFAATLSDSIFSRYGYPGVELELTVPLEVAVDYKVGDYLFIEHKTLIAWEGDTQGLPGIKEETGEIVDPYDGLAYFDVGHEWGAFLGENTLGKAIDGTWVITTTQREISHKIFNSQDKNFESCVKNHTRIEAWLKKEGIA